LISKDFKSDIVLFLGQVRKSAQMKKILLLITLIITSAAHPSAADDNTLFEHLKTMTYEYGLLGDVHEALRGDQLTNRAYAATYMGKYGTYKSVPLLINALSDESVHVGAHYADAGMATTRHRAYLALKELTGEDFGFVWNAPIEERAAVIAQYKDWLAERDLIIALVRTYMKDNNLAGYDIYRVHFINKEKSKWGASLTKDPPMPGAPGLTIDAATHKITMIKGR